MQSEEVFNSSLIGSNEEQKNCLQMTTEAPLPENAYIVCWDHDSDEILKASVTLPWSHDADWAADFHVNLNPKQDFFNAKDGKKYLQHYWKSIYPPLDWFIWDIFHI